MNLGTKNAGHTKRSGGCYLGRRDSEKDLGTVVDNQINMSFYSSVAAKRDSWQEDVKDG